VAGLHLVVRVTGGAFAAVGHHVSSADLRDPFDANFVLAIADLDASGAYSKDGEGFEKELAFRFTNVSLFTDGCPTFYPSGSRNALTAEVTMKIMR
jgi:hypothetical protein